jgi:hypothetical protein
MICSASNRVPVIPTGILTQSPKKTHAFLKLLCKALIKLAPDCRPQKTIQPAVGKPNNPTRYEGE